jgi:hypothetical protein
MDTTSEKRRKLGTSADKAGGAKTTKNGKAFEKKFRHLFERIIIGSGFKRIEENKKRKMNYHFHKKLNGNDEVWIAQEESARDLLKEKFPGIFSYAFPMRNTVLESKTKEGRKADVLILIHKDGEFHLKIIEIKAQSCNGSVDLKLYAGEGIIDEYRHENISSIKYCFYINDWVANNIITQHIIDFNRKRNIPIFKEVDIRQLLQWVDPENKN